MTDPAFLVTRNMEDFVTWVDTSKIKRKVQKYNEVCQCVPMCCNGQEQARASSGML